jgi:dihydrofolate synthase/folylpolyglutamate synthase
VELALTSYAEALRYLFARTSGGWRLGVERTASLLRLLGDPHRRYPVFHVGGTNGKGSVVATLDALLRRAGWRVGRYTSPHLVDFRERILVNGRPIGEDAVEGWVARWAGEVERLGATFFEATTSMAFDLLARERVDVAIVEVGLGGRLDATNVVDPAAAAVTSIGLDHTQYLGSTLVEIAAEKAGIFKPGRPAVIGEPDPAIRARLATLASDAGASPVVVVAEACPPEDVRVTEGGTDFALLRGGGRRWLRTPLIGEHQATNAAVALAMLDAAGPRYAAAAADAQRALADVWLPGRFQRVGSMIFDVAHNVASAEVLAGTLDVVRPARPLVALVAVLDDKDWRGILDLLAPRAERFVLTAAPTAPASRAWRLDEACAYAATLGVPLECEPDFDRALARARDGAATTLVAGSFHTVGDAMLRLQLSPLAG